MKKIFLLTCLVFVLQSINAQKKQFYKRKTVVSIVGNQFYINGEPTFKGKYWNGFSIEGLLPNSRMVQGIFDDQNDSTRKLWAYPDTKVWDANRNTNEFVAAMPEWKKHGLLAFTLNLQGGSPYGYSKEQPWINTAIDSTGKLKPNYLLRLEKILNKADELNMVCILGLYYFGQDERVKDEAAIKKSIVEIIKWLHQKKYKNVLIEVNNECNPKGYEHEILQPKRVHELIELAKSIKNKEGYSYLVSTSFVGKQRPTKKVLEVMDFILVHGNGIANQDTLTAYYNECKALMGKKVMPIVNNEDDHFAFNKPSNNMITSFKNYVSWGYFDFRKKNETDFTIGYQSMPCSWQIDSERKKDFFSLLKQITGGFK